MIGNERVPGDLNKATVAKVALVIVLVSMAVLATYFVYPYTQPHEIVGVAVGKDEGNRTVSLYLLTDDRVNGMSANQLFDYTVEQEDFYWIQKGDIIVARVKGSTASVVNIRSSPSETPLNVYHERCSSVDGGMCLFGFIPINLPRNFTVGCTWIDDFWTDHTHYFGLRMHPHDKIRFSFNSTEPIHFEMGLSRELETDLLREPQIEYDVVALTSYEEILIEEQSIASYSLEFEAQENGLYIFVFYIDPPKTSRVSFNGVRVWP